VIVEPVSLPLSSLCQVRDIKPFLLNMIPCSPLQLLKNAILDKYDLNEHATWILSANRKQYEVSEPKNPY
jgi:hypothetical protein